MSADAASVLRRHLLLTKHELDNNSTTSVSKTSLIEDNSLCPAEPLHLESLRSASSPRPRQTQIRRGRLGARSSSSVVFTREGAAAAQNPDATVKHGGLDCVRSRSERHVKAESLR
jgi:hypothetical protein